MSILTLLLLLLTANAAQAGSTPLPTAADVLERSLAYHDPENIWSSRPIEITAEVRLAERLASERGYASRTDRIRRRQRRGQVPVLVGEGHRIASRSAAYGGTFSARLNGSAGDRRRGPAEHRLADRSASRLARLLHLRVRPTDEAARPRHTAGFRGHANRVRRPGTYSRCA